MKIWDNYFEDGNIIGIGRLVEDTMQEKIADVEFRYIRLKFTLFFKHYSQELATEWICLTGDELTSMISHEAYTRQKQGYTDLFKQVPNNLKCLQTL